jgi:hypothetical protein
MHIWQVGSTRSYRVSLSKKVSLIDGLKIDVKSRSFPSILLVMGTFVMIKVCCTHLIKKKESGLSPFVDQATATSGAFCPFMPPDMGKGQTLVEWSCTGAMRLARFA